jgi:hypothetical protein
MDSNDSSVRLPPPEELPPQGQRCLLPQQQQDFSLRFCCSASEALQHEKYSHGNTRSFLSYCQARLAWLDSVVKAYQRENVQLWQRNTQLQLAVNHLVCEWYHHWNAS